MTVKVVGSNGDAGLLAETPATPKQVVGIEGAVGGSGLLPGHTVSGYKWLYSSSALAPVRPRTGRYERTHEQI